MDAKEFRAKVDEYFEKTKLEKQNIAGLCLFLGCTKKELENKRTDKNFKKTMDTIDLRFEEKYLMMLQNGKLSAANFKVLMENLYGTTGGKADKVEQTVESYLMGMKMSA